MSTRTTCQHCRHIVLRRSDGVWFSNPSAATDGSFGYRCATSPDRQHAPASDETSTEVLRLRARVAELEVELER